MAAYILPGETTIAIFGVLILALIYLALSVVKLREQVARLEEWQRNVEKRLNGRKGG